ncbi:rhamnogalacturonyl hydrolase YesR [soil metagenome]
MKVEVSFLQDTAHRAAQRLLSHPWKLWFWGDSIGLEGLLDASQTTGDPRFAGFVYGIMKAWAARNLPRGEWDYTAAGVALLRVHAETQDPSLLKLARDHAEYLAGFRRSDCGIFMRYENAAFELPPELPVDHPDAPLTDAKTDKVQNGGPCAFVDTVHFDAPFFAALFHSTGEAQYEALAAGTLFSQIDLLFDEEVSLFHHFWIERIRQPNRVFWGRGNGWALLGLVHTLGYLQKGGGNYPRILETLRRLAEAMARLQDSSGHWHTVLDDPGSYLETSIAAFVVDGFSVALRHGWIEPSHQAVVDRALEAVLKSMHPDGLLDGVSYETFPSTRAEHYRTMPCGAMVPWGQGPLLTAIHSFLIARKKG